ncbi:MAG: energy transducer TonB [Alphaproteobacteria bacterium]
MQLVAPRCIMGVPLTRRLSAVWLMLLSAIGTLSFTIGTVQAQLQFPGSLMPVGSWEIVAQAGERSLAFERCMIRRLQNDGSIFLIMQGPTGIQWIAAAAPQWGLELNETYPTSFAIGSNTFTFEGVPYRKTAMQWRPSPEFFSELKAGRQLSVTANQRHYVLNLEGIETAMARLTPCTKEYAGRAVPPPAPPAPAPAAAARGSIQTVPFTELMIQPPKPTYPASSRQAGEQGTVLIDAQIGVDGLVVVVAVRRSSGYPALDQAAQEAVKAARFRPYTASGKAQAVWVQIPMRFALSSEGKPGGN